MKKFIITFAFPFLLFTGISAAGSLEDARFFEKFYLASAIKVEAIPTSKIGTGFFAKLQQDPSALIFSTVKHLIEGADSLKLIVPLTDSTHALIKPATIEVPLFKDTVRLYYEPPGETDLILMAIDRGLITKAKLELGLLKVEYISLPYESFSRVDLLFAGQPVLFSGYPLGLSVNGYKPLLRKGSIAGIDTTRNLIFLDADAFGGSSGSPVFIDFSSQTNVEFFETYKQDVIGMIAGYVYEKRPLAIQTGQTGIVQEENTGIAVVIPAETIRKEAELFLAKQR